MGTQHQTSTKDLTEAVAGTFPADFAIRLAPDFAIEARPEHSHSIVAELYDLLRRTGRAEKLIVHCDPRRKDFYDLESNGRIYFVYVFPDGNRVLLLATWLRQDSEVIHKVAG